MRLQVPGRSVLAGLALLALAAAADAQQQPANSSDAPPRRQRVALEQRVQQGLGRLMRERVGLSDAQIRQLAPVRQRFEARRRELLTGERAARTELRRLIQAGGTDSTTQARVAALIAQLHDLQRRRVQLFEDEQRELAGFMTPVQRARYQAVQENIRRRVQAGAQRPPGR